MGTSAYPDEGPGPYFRHPPDVWHPSLPAEEELELGGRPFKRALYVAGQFLWILLSSPVWLVLVLVRWPSLPSSPNWGFRQRLIIPLMGRVFWAMTILGDPREETFDEARKDPTAFELKHGRPRKDDGHGVTVEELDLPVPDEERSKNWFLPSEAGGVLDPNGVVEPARVPTYSYWREPLTSGGTAFSLARKGETAALWLFRGGFVHGHGLDPMAFEFCRRTGMRVFAPNYRKATSIDKAFPAALQDAMLVYAHLVDKLRFERVVLVGTSAGASIALSLLLALARLPAAKMRMAVIPTHVVLDGPCPNLVELDSPSCLSNLGVDLIQLGMLHRMFFAYSRNLLANPLPAHSLHVQSPFHPSHLRRHPFLSPSLPPSVPWFSQLLKSARLGGPRIWLSFGTAELTADHCRGLRDRLKEAGWKEAGTGPGGGGRLVVVEAEGETHGWHTYPHFLTKEGRTYWPRLLAFLDSS